MRKSKKTTVFNPCHFINKVTPESAYIFGLLWADGYLGNDLNCSIRIEMVESDMSMLRGIFDKTGKWNYYFRRRKNWKPQMLAAINNRPFYEFLVLHNYKDKSKSGVSASKILKHIPANLHQFFFRGLVDGDGSFYLNLKNYIRHFICSSCYKQDWSYFENLLKMLQIPYRIDHRIVLNKLKKENRHSCLRITSKPAIIKFADYLYHGYLLDQIGLPRKFEKCQTIINS